MDLNGSVYRTSSPGNVEFGSNGSYLAFGIWFVIMQIKVSEKVSVPAIVKNKLIAFK